MSAPRDEYAARLARRVQIRERLSAADARVSVFRLLLFAIALAAAIVAWRGTISWWWLTAPIGVFAGLVHWHDRIIRARDHAGRAILFYERGIARLDDRWAGTGEPGDRFADPAHLYAADLDLFGSASLFELLSVARTQAGEEVLASWLKAAASPRTIRERQRGVEELATRLDFRESLALAGTDVRASVHGDALVAWAESPAALTPRWLRPAAVILTASVILAAIVSIVTDRYGMLLFVLLLEAVLWFSRRTQIEQVLHTAGGWSRDLDVLAYLLTLLQREAFDSPALTRLRDRLDAAGVAPATAIGRLHRLVEMHDWQHNMIFAVIGAPLLWDAHIACAMEGWRHRYGGQVRVWLRTVAEFEAFSSLAAYRFEHPDDPFPDVLDEPAIATFEGTSLGHPLLPAQRMVRNDMQLTRPTRLLVVSGSNMSGKSTLLRTVGVNAVLAMAGAPVRAASLRMSPLAIGATLRIQDSLQEGRSRFYAEISRIGAIADLTNGDRPVLFLLDEIFHGTNSHDRRVGASGVLRALLDKGAVGLITTHDLALTAVVDELFPRAVNVHFDDQFADQELHFDYVMKPGPVTRSNAIALMRAVGLQVPAATDDGS